MLRISPESYIAFFQKSHPECRPKVFLIIQELRGKYQVYGLDNYIKRSLLHSPTKF